MTLLVKAPEVVTHRLELQTVVGANEVGKPRLADAVGRFANKVCALTANCGQAACKFNVSVNPPTDNYEGSKLLDYGPVVTLIPELPDGVDCQFRCVGEPPLQDALGSFRDGIVVAYIERTAYLPCRPGR